MVHQKKTMGFLLCILFLSFYLENSCGQIQQSKAIRENHFIPDQGNNYYMNPIFPGNYGDPSIVCVNKDYYMAFSRWNGMSIWHSRDLVNWEPLLRHRLPPGYNKVWAVDLQYFNGVFHLYMPISKYPGKKEKGFGNFVIIAKNPTGPWSDPVNLEIPVPEGDYSGIDPGFIQTPEGEKYLYVNHGYVTRLNDEGNKALYTPEQVYDGWKYPEDWVVQCKCLESPKLFYKDGFYYMISAQGGTNGPSTAHMSIVARAEHPTGPWVNSPYNPLSHTWSEEDKFWHQGHGTVFEDGYGKWWTIYHGRLNNYEGMGRPTLLMPVEWTSDGWPVVKSGILPENIIPKPEGTAVIHGMKLSDDFMDTEPGMQWNFNNEQADQITTGQGKLILTASGNNYTDAMSIHQYAVNKSFEVQVKITGASKDCTSGIRLGNTGISTNGSQVFFTDAPDWRQRHSVYSLKKKSCVWLKLVNYRKNISLFYSSDGKTWKKFVDSTRNPDSYNIILFAYGKGKADFQNFYYTGLE